MHGAAESIDRCGLVASCRRISRGSYSQAAFWGDEDLFHLRPTIPLVEPNRFRGTTMGGPRHRLAFLAWKAWQRSCSTAKCRWKSSPNNRSWTAFGFWFLGHLKAVPSTILRRDLQPLPVVGMFIRKTSILWQQIRSNLLIDHKQWRVTQLW